MTVAALDTPTARPSTPSRGLGTGFAIATDHLTKRFGSQTVVNDVNLRVPTGSVFGFLGPNGSGKTTTIRMMLGLLTPDNGAVAVLGQPIPEQSRRVLTEVGSLIDGPACYPWLTGRQNLERLDAFGPDPRRDTRRERIDEALARVGLTNAGDKKFKAYSLGMRQRLGLAGALLRPRKLLILDEPTNGMDPQGTREIRHLVRDLAADGTTVFLSSHLLAEIEQVCTHIAIMSVGRLVAQGSLDELRSAAPPQLRVETDDVDAAIVALTTAGLSPGIEPTHRVVTASVTTGVRAEDLCRLLVNHDVGIRGFRMEQPSLEDTFVALTGEGFNVAQ